MRAWNWTLCEWTDNTRRGTPVVLSIVTASRMLLHRPLRRKGYDVTMTSPCVGLWLVRGGGSV
jgi:hypothetical protein